MSSIHGKNSLSFRRVKIDESSSSATTISQDIKFAHRASAGETQIDLTALVLPSVEMPNFSNPTGTELVAINLMINKKRMEEFENSCTQLLHITKETVTADQYLRMMMRFAPCPMWCRTTTGAFVWVNEAFEKLFKVSYHKIIGHVCSFTEEEEITMTEEGKFHEFSFLGIDVNVYSYPLLKKGVLIGIASAIIPEEVFKDNNGR